MKAWWGTENGEHPEVFLLPVAQSNSLSFPPLCSLIQAFSGVLYVDKRLVSCVKIWLFISQPRSLQNAMER